MQPRAALGPQSSTGKQVVELNGYVIIVVECRDGKIKLYGSPADKDNLEVGDEILDVNERVLEDLPRAEAIRYIHECIQSCVIKLRVKRRSDARLAQELCNSVQQDAFVIAVEQQARERLQRLSALKRITPVDMSQLSIKLNQQSQTKGATTQDFSFLKEASPIYVTSLTGNHVSGTTTLTTGTASTINHNNSQNSGWNNSNQSQPIIAQQPQSEQLQQPTKQQQQNNNQQTSTTATPPITVTSGGLQQISTNLPNLQQHPPSILANNQQQLHQLTHQVLINHHENIGSQTINNQVTTSSTNNQQPQQIYGNLNNNNNHNNSNITSNSGAGLTKFYGNNIQNNELLLANGHGPRRELSTLSEGDSEPAEEPYEQQKIISKGSAAQLLQSSGGTEVLLGDQSIRSDIRRRGSGLSALGEETIKSRLPFDDYLGHHTDYTANQADTGVELDMLTMLSVNQDNGPHREMAVDVPESFIARNKTPPRYPPPRPPNQVNHIPNGAMPQVAKSSSTTTTSNGSLNIEMQPLDSSFHLHHLKNSPSLDSSNEFSKKSSSKAPSSIGSTCESIGFDSMSYRTKSRGSLSTRSSSSGDLDGPPEYDLGPHRELPVDVPDSFIEIKKAPPRYPPPKKPPQVISEICKNTTETDSSSSSINGSSLEKQLPQPQAPIRNNELNGSVRPVPPPRDHLRMEKDGRLLNRAPAPQVPDRKTSNHQQQIAQIMDPTSEQMDSIKKYQEQLRRRQEEAERILQQNDFRRASIRGSRKLQALQDSPLQERPVGIENDAYAEDEEIEVIAGYSELISELQKLQNELNKQGLAGLASRVTAAQQLLSGPNIARALAIRTAVLQRRRPRINNPVCTNAQTLAKDCVESLAQSSSPAAIELCDLLSTYEMEGLLLAHDRIATTTDRTPATLIHSTPRESFINKSHNQNNANIVNNNVLKQREPISLPPTAAGILRDQDPIRIIQIEKSSDTLGATIVNEGDAVVIGRIVVGGAAHKSGLLHKHDEILEINGIEMSGKSINDVCALLSAMNGTLTFLIVPGGSPPPGREATLHVRAHFDYKPQDDMYIPCRELGISFEKGDVLHVISRDDANWWQAYREDEEEQTLAGLIPSQSFQHQRESMKQAIAGEAGLTGGNRGVGKGAAKGSTLLCVKKSGKNRKKKGRTTSEAGYPLYATTTPDEPDPEEILTYEEVALYYPHKYHPHKRPIVLIGPPNIGRHELRQRLMADSDRFAAAVPHTSRQRRDGEVPGQDYHFISRVQFEADILSRKFVEHGEYERAYYGTSLEAIRTVVYSGKICVLNLHPQSLKLLRASDLRPYVVLIAPPPLEVLRQKKGKSGESFKDDDLKDIIATTRDMEARWGHLFDDIIINSDTERAYHKLLNEINLLEREPQWVPASWVNK